MARRKLKAVDTRGSLQRIHDRHAAQAENEALAVLTPEMEAKGTYASSIHPSQGRRFVNNHDPVERWKAAGRLTQAQVVVIEMVQRLWRLAGLQQRVTASYGERMAATHGYELRALDEIEAREDLHRIQDYVPRGYWAVFEAVCRHGMSAGVSGELLGHGRNGAETRAHQVVCLVCDVVAMREGLACAIW